MRRVFRRDLSAKTVRELNRKQLRADMKREAGMLNVNEEWQRARRNKPLKEAYDTLREMAGERERCMYCGDSHGADIEHFWPKASYPERMFRWPNMLLSCTECGRIKGDRFPLLEGVPALIDPSIENPWNFLDFDPQTGNIVARYDLARQQYILKGVQTVAVLRLDRREAISRGYQRTFQRIEERVRAILEQPQPDADTLFHELRQADDHGLLGWCFDGSGSAVPPFTDLRERHPEVW